MKKLTLVLTACLIVLSVQAQKEHLKFMGIPLNGTISAFQTKLQAKGIKYDAKTSIQMKSPCRAFRGIFSGEKAEIYIYYNEKTKVVYRAKAVITYSTKEIGEGKFADFKYMLKTKYANGYSFDSEQDGHPALTLEVPDSKDESWIGTIDLFMATPPYSFMDEVYLHIDYTDMPNRRVNENKNMDDL